MARAIETRRDTAVAGGWAAGLRWVLLAALAVLLSVSNPLADRAAQYNRDVTIGTTALYGTLRVMNSVMSVAKDADVTGGVGVASVTASPGQLLQPVTNTIDRMADLLFWLAIVSGVLSTLFLPVAKVAAFGLAGVSVLRALTCLARRRLPGAGERLLHALLMLCLLGAVVLPLSYAVAFHAGARMTDDAWRGATGVFDRINQDYDAEAAGQLDALTEGTATTDALRDGAALPGAATPAPAPGFLGRLGAAVDQSQSAISGTVSAASNLVTSLTEGVAAKTKVISDGIAISSDLFTASIAIAVSYLVKILVMPVLILAASLYLMRAAFR